MTRTNDKIRALVLAALMVLSVFAGTVAFTGTAAAANSITVNTLDPSTVDSGETVTHDYDVTITGVSPDGGTDTYEVTLPSSASFDTDGTNTATVTDGNGNDIAVTGTSFSDANGGTNNVLQVTIGPDSSAQTSEELTFTGQITVEFPTVNSDTDVPVNVAFEDSNGDNVNTDATVTINGQNRASDRVFLGEENVDLSGAVGTTTSYTGISGEADGTSASVDDPTDADITEVNGFAVGGYDSDGDDRAEFTVVDPEIVGVTLFSGSGTDGADVTNGRVTTNTDTVTVETEFNFPAAEGLDVSVEDDDGFDVSNQLGVGADTDADGDSTVQTVELTNVDELNSGTYTVTVEADGDLDASSSATFNVSDADTTITLDETEVTQGDDVTATVTGDPGVTRFVQVDTDSAATDDDDASTIFANTGDVNDRTESGDFYVAEVDLGDDGEAQVRIQTSALEADETATFEVANSAGGDAEDDVDLRVNEQEITIDDAPSVVAVGEDFAINGTAAESDEVAAYARIDQDWERISGDENPVDVDDDGSYELELTASSPLNLPESYRVGIVNEEAVSDGSFPDQIDNDVWGDFQSTTSTSIRTVEGELSAELSSSSIAADVGDEVTLSGAAVGQGDEVRYYVIGPRGDVAFETTNIDENEFEADLSGFDRRGQYQIVVVSEGRDGNFAADSESGSTADIGIGGDETPGQALEIVLDAYEGAGVDDPVVQLNLSAENPSISIDDFTTDGQVGQGEVTISGDSNREDETPVFIEVLDNNNNVIASTETEVNGTTGTYETTLDMSNVEPGEYTLRVDDGEASQSLEFELVEGEVSTPTPEPEDTETPTPTPEPEDTETATPEPEDTETATPEPTEETTTTTPGFGAVVAVLALLGAALLALRRD